MFLGTSIGKHIFFFHHRDGKVLRYRGTRSLFQNHDFNWGFKMQRNSWIGYVYCCKGFEASEQTNS